MATITLRSDGVHGSFQITARARNPGMVLIQFDLAAGGSPLRHHHVRLDLVHPYFLDYAELTLGGLAYRSTATAAWKPCDQYLAPVVRFSTAGVGATEIAAANDLSGVLYRGSGGGLAKVANGSPAPIVVLPNWFESRTSPAEVESLLLYFPYLEIDGRATLRFTVAEGAPAPTEMSIEVGATDSFPFDAATYT